MANFPARYALHDTELGGRTIRCGDVLVLGLAAANADPAVRPSDPYDMLGNRAHLAFSSGAHACPAQVPARLIAKTAVETALRGLPEVRLSVPDGELPWRASPWTHCPASLPVSFAPAAERTAAERTAASRPGASGAASRPGASPGGAPGAGAAGAPPGGASPAAEAPAGGPSAGAPSPRVSRPAQTGPPPGRVPAPPRIAAVAAGRTAPASPVPPAAPPGRTGPAAP